MRERMDRAGRAKDKGERGRWGEQQPTDAFSGVDYRLTPPVRDDRPKRWRVERKERGRVRDGGATKVASPSLRLALAMP
jgi:hypothetical protein